MTLLPILAGPEKILTNPFAFCFKYLGFTWDLSAKTVQVPKSKKEHYLLKLRPWAHGQKFSRKDAESLLGTLIHCLLAVPDGCLCLPTISRFVISFNYASFSFIRKSPSPGVLTDIDWWHTQLSANFCGSSITNPLPCLLLISGLMPHLLGASALSLGVNGTHGG